MAVRLNILTVAASSTSVSLAVDVRFIGEVMAKKHSSKKQAKKKRVRPSTRRVAKTQKPHSTKRVVKRKKGSAANTPVTDLPPIQLPPPDSEIQ